MRDFLRPLGNTGIEVSALGLGTVKIGRNRGVKYPAGFELPGDNAVRDLLALARDEGINLIDTAPAYGTSESRLGRLLSARDEWVIVSKVGEEFENGISHFDFSARHVRHSVERSLTRLRTDRIDVMLVHSDGNDDAILDDGEAFETLRALKAEGKIRAFGLSGKTVRGGMRALEHADVGMVTYNLEYDEELPVIEYARQHNKGILIKKAFASGHACVTHTDPVRASLGKILGTGGVTSVVLGTINPEHLRQNVAVARGLIARGLLPE